VQLWKPIDRAGAPINLCVRVALRAPGNTEQLAIVGFRRLVHTLRVRPIRIVSPCEVSWWIGARLRCCLVRMSQNVYGEKDGACRHGEQRKQRSLIHANILTDMCKEYLSISKEQMRARGFVSCGHRCSRIVREARVGGKPMDPTTFVAETGQVASLSGDPTHRELTHAELLFCVRFLQSTGWIPQESDSGLRLVLPRCVQIVGAYRVRVRMEGRSAS
jgi:hypothetical protein